ncbi:replicative DNA helicase [Stratiformator vulcanicus]|uniref:Replicative DNA helicase n=1 Tax=Stratiformator vulcanicus TaxID=2527980 RepID=A0A517R7E2_9PLAN|nr:replicative DNA helicase [Stratiformator vulcanicus]QDT39753.1 Replicative DNA helicase [Stratiformator vulcanicus]
MPPQAQRDGSPPEDLEAERSLIGGVLLQASKLDDIGEFFRPEMFHRERHAFIYRAAWALYERGRKVDTVTVAEQLQRDGKLDEAGGPAYLLDCLEAVPQAGHAVHYAQIVRDCALRRAVLYAGLTMAQTAHDRTRDVSEVVASAWDALSQTSDDVHDDGAVSLDVAVRTAWEAFETGQEPGLKTGFFDLDGLTHGLRPGQIVVLAARPSMGKTALAGNIALNVAEAGDGVLLFSLEQSKEEIAVRMLSSLAAIDSHRIKEPGTLLEHERERILQRNAQVQNLPLVIDDRPAATTGRMGAIVRRYRRRRLGPTGDGVKLVIVDYLQLIEPEDRRVPREQQVSTISRQLKAIARTAEVPIIVLAQLNRQSEMRENKRPRLSDLRESGAIEQDADIVMLLHRPSFFDKGDRPGEADLIIAKQRDGATGTVPLTWAENRTQFLDASRAEEPAGYTETDLGF